MKLIIDIDKDVYKRLTSSPSYSDEDVVQSVVDRMLLVKAVREAIPYKESEAENELKPTKDLINDIVGFDVSVIKPLPEFKESEAENE